MSRRRGPTRVLTVALRAALAAYPFSVLFHVSHYGADVAWTVQGRFVGCYWSDRTPPDVRNSWVYNGWAVPWESFGTGRGWDGSPVWDIEPPWEVWHPAYLEALLVDGSFLKYQLGVMWPSLVLNSSRHRFEPDSIVVPIWLIGALMGLPWLAIRLRTVRKYPEGSCQACGYALTGNVSGRCPECGAIVVGQPPMATTKGRSP